MRRFVLGGIGAGVALSAAAGQDPAAPPRPAAARIVAVQAVAPADPAARGQQAETPKPMPTPPGGSVPGTNLGTPRPFTQGPNVTELRNGTIPPPTFGAPYPQGGYPITVPYQPGVGVPVVAAPPAGVPVGGGLFPPPVDIEQPLYGACPPGAGGGMAAATSACNKWWVSGEYLLWWTKSAQFPPLVTTSTLDSSAIVGTPGTSVLVGDGSLSRTLHSGGRFGVGYWLGTDQRWAAEGSVFFLGTNTTEFRADSSTYPILARPFQELNTNTPLTEIITRPDVGIGAVAVKNQDSLWGAEANLRRFVTKTGCARLDFIGGFRFVRLTEDLTITEQFARTSTSDATIGNPDVMAGTVRDQFRTENNFYGGQIGLNAEVRRGRWFSTLTGKVAFGTMFQTAQIEGRQELFFRDGTFGTAAGGLLALPTNSGTFSQSKFAVVPEIGLNIGYHVTPHCRVFVGYNFLYLSSVLRPGPQIDTGLDVTRIPNFPTDQLPGGTRTPLSTPRPAPTLRDSDFYAQGVNFGLQFTW